MRLRAAKALLRALGFDAPPPPPGAPYAPDFSAQDNEIIAACLPYTLTGPERLHALIESVRYVTRARIGGAIVECGVWRGGSLLAAAMALRACGVEDRDLYGYDTFAGMVRPGEHDVDFAGNPASARYSQAEQEGGGSAWCAASLNETKQVVQRSGYPAARIHLIEGRVEETIPAKAPAEIAILRLDTDWYESTRHELEHLYPRLAAGGVLILDDYGHWRGSRKAADEYFAAHRIDLFLARIDYTARIAVKR